MRATLLFIVVWCGAALAQQPRGSRCWAACERNVSDARTRASACTACLTHPQDPAAWLPLAPTPSAKLLTDPDWQVRWAGVEQAAEKGEGPGKPLSAWLARATGAELTTACVTATHAAGRAKQTLSELLGRDVKRCEAQTAAVTQQLQTELYDESMTVRLDALKHASAAWGRTPARVVLDAVPTHPPAFDGLVLDLLHEWASETPQSAPSMLLSEAKEADVATMNRLLAVLSRRADEARASLAATKDALERKEAMVKLVGLSPLTEPDLLVGLLDVDPVVRRSAVHGLKRGFGGTVAQAAQRFLSKEHAATWEQQRALLEFMGDAGEPECAAQALAFWRDATLEARLRRASLRVTASCGWAAAKPEVDRVLRDTSAPEDVAAAVAALAYAPNHPQTWERLERALANPAAEVRARACDAAGHHRWRLGLNRILPLAKDASPEVRLAALRSLNELDAPALDLLLVAGLQGDGDAQVRAFCAGALGEYGGPRGLAALDAAARNDPDANVKLVAGKSLRRLGAGTPP